MKERLKSRVVWGAVLAQVIIIIGVFLPDATITEEIKVVFTAVLEIFTIFGILNNPTDKENF